MTDLNHGDGADGALMGQLPHDLAAALSEHSPQVPIYASALFPMPQSPTGWVLIQPMIPISNDDLERLGGYLTTKHLPYADSTATRAEAVEEIVRTVIADLMLVVTGSVTIDAYAPPPTLNGPPPEPIEPDRTPFTMQPSPPPLPPEPPRFVLPPHLRPTDVTLDAVIDATTAAGRAEPYVTAGVPHSFRPRIVQGIPTSVCECGLTPTSPIHQ